MKEKLDLRIQKTYQALQSAFTRLLEEKAFEEITVNELCDAAMIRRTTFYKHFADKYEYFSFYLLGLRETFKSQIPSETIIADPTGYAVTMLQEMFKFTRRHEKLVNGLRNSNMMTFLYQSLQEQFVEELRYVFTTVYKKTMTPELELLISFYAGGLINVIYWWLNNRDTLDENEITQFIVKNIALPTSLFEL